MRSMIWRITGGRMKSKTITFCPMRFNSSGSAEEMLEKGMHAAEDLFSHHIVIDIFFRIDVEHGPARDRAHQRATGALVELVYADVAGENDDGFGKIDRFAAPVGHAAIFQNLQEFIQDARVRFLDLIEEQHAEGVRAYMIGELAAFFIADIAGGRSEQALIGVRQAIFTHVEAHAGLFGAEDQLGQRFGHLRFADAGRSGEEEHAARFGAAGMLRTGQVQARAPHHIRHGGYCGSLPDDALREDFLRRLQFIPVQVIPFGLAYAVFITIDERFGVQVRILRAARHGADAAQVAYGHAVRQVNHLEQIELHPRFAAGLRCGGFFRGLLPVRPRRQPPRTALQRGVSAGVSSGSSVATATAGSSRTASASSALISSAPVSSALSPPAAC